MIAEGFLRNAQKTLALQQRLWKNCSTLNDLTQQRIQVMPFFDRCLLHPPPLEWFQAQPHSGCAFFMSAPEARTVSPGGICPGAAGVDGIPWRDVDFRRCGRAIRTGGTPGAHSRSIAQRWRNREPQPPAKALITAYAATPPLRMTCVSSVAGSWAAGSWAAGSWVATGSRAGNSAAVDSGVDSSAADSSAAADGHKAGPVPGACS